MPLAHVVCNSIVLEKCDAMSSHSNAKWPLSDAQVVSIVFFTPTWRPDSFYDKIAANRSRGLHTLCLLDIKVKEPSDEALCRGKKIYEPPRYMTIQTVIPSDRMM